MKRPIIIVLISYIIGIIWGLCFEKNIALVCICTISLILIFYTKFKCKNYIYIFIVVILCSNFVITYKNNKFNRFYKETPEEAQYIATVISNKESKEQKDVYTIKIHSINGIKYKNIKLNLEILNSYNINLKYGDKITFYGKYQEPMPKKNYRGFDQKMYLKTLNIYGKVSLLKNNINVLKRENINYIFYNVNRLKLKIEKSLQEKFSEEEFSFLDGLLLGNTDKIANDLKEDFRNSGVYHLLAISGTHINYLIILLHIFTNRLNITKRAKKITIIVMVIFYSMLITLHESAIRAVIMSIIFISGEILYRKNDFINSIIITMLIMLIINPYWIMSIGFQLSFAGVMGIAIYNSEKENRLSKKKLLRNVYKKLSLTLCIQLVIIPIMIINFHTLSLFGIIVNFFLSDLIGIIIILGFIITIFSIFPFEVFNFLVYVEKFLINIILKIIKVVGSFEISKVYMIYPGMIVIILYYIIIFTYTKRREFIVIFTQIKLKNNRNKIKFFILISVIFIIITYLFNQQLKIYFIDVGQGDCTLFVTPHNKKILIDGGGNENGNEIFDIGEKTLLPYLLNRKVKTLDYVMISHFDSDHCGGLEAVLKNLKVKNLIIAKQVENSSNFERIFKIAKEKNINFIVVKAGDCIHIEKNIEIQILAPFKKMEALDINNNSIVAKVMYKNFSILLTGDIEKETEKLLVKKYENYLHSTILKVAHHGSNTSSTEEFLEFVNPKISLIGAGENNKYGHPNLEVIERLNTLKCEICRTDKNGEISIKISKNGIILLKRLIE